MREELLEMMQGYVAGTLDRRALRYWVDAFDWDDTSPEMTELRPLIGRLELILEIGEGFRNEDELKSVARELLDTQGAARRLTSTV